MSNTYKEKIKGKLRRKKNFDDYINYYDSLSGEDQKKIINYNRNPSWWNRKMNNIPKRRQDRILCKLTVNNNPDEYEKFIFSDDRKPCSWYW